MKYYPLPPLYALLTFVTVEFIHLISSEANEICEKESKKTIAPEHIISALEVRRRIHGLMLDSQYISRRNLALSSLNRRSKMC